jgi:hypothetical protein
MPCRAPGVLWPYRFESEATAQHDRGTAWTRLGMCQVTSAVSWRTVGDQPRFGFFRLPDAHSRRFLTRMLLPFGMCLICSDGVGDSRLHRIIHFYELSLKLKSVFLLLLCYVSSVYSYSHCLWATDSRLQISKYSLWNIWKNVVCHLSDVKQSVKYFFPFSCSKHIMNPVFWFLSLFFFWKNMKPTCNCHVLTTVKSRTTDFKRGSVELLD